MRRYLIVALLAVGCAKSNDFDSEGSGGWSKGSPRFVGGRTEIEPTRQQRPTLPGPTTVPTKLTAPGQQEVAAAVRDFLGQTYQGINVTKQSEPIEFLGVFEAKRANWPGWVVTVSYTAVNGRLMCNETGTDHSFLVSRSAVNGPVTCYWQGRTQPEVRDRLGEDWVIRHRPPNPKTTTVP